MTNTLQVASRPQSSPWYTDNGLGGIADLLMQYAQDQPDTPAGTPGSSGNPFDPTSVKPVTMNPGQGIFGTMADPVETVYSPGNSPIVETMDVPLPAQYVNPQSGLNASLVQKPTFESMFSRQFPSLFPSSTNIPFQYGG